MTEQLSTRTRWLALVILCVGDLMIVVDTTVVNVALPSIRRDLGFSQTSLAWVVNAYMLTFGGFLLLAGRFGDLFGHRRLFLGGKAAGHDLGLHLAVGRQQGPHRPGVVARDGPGDLAGPAEQVLVPHHLADQPGHLDPVLDRHARRAGRLRGRQDRRTRHDAG